MHEVTASPLTAAARRPRASWGLVARLHDTPRWRVLVGLAAALGGLLRLACWLRPYETLDRAYVPDDTYYTLTIARSLAHGDGPTVDGSTLTSGFQALHGFVLVPVFWLVDGARAAAHVNLGIMFLADTALIVALGWLGYRLAGTVGAAVAAGLWAASPLALAMAAGGLETSLAMLVEATLVVAWVWAHDRPSTRRWVVVGVLAGLAVLARVDAVLLVAVLAVLGLWRGERRALATWGPVGALTLAPWWGWCWLTLGTPVPTSGDAARALAPHGAFDREMLAVVVGAVAGGPLGSLDDTRRWLTTHTGTAAWWYGVVLAALVAVAAWWLRPRRAGDRVAPDTVAGRDGDGDGDGDGDTDTDTDTVAAGDDDVARLGAAALAVFGLGLCVFYAWYGLPWYAYRYLAPVGMTVTLAVAALAAGAGAWMRAGVPALAARRATAGHDARAGADGERGGGRHSRPPVALLRLAGATAVLALVGVGTAATVGRGVAFAQVTPTDGFSGDADTGEYEPAERALSHVPDGARVGGWQSGALGYVADGRVTVVNLDGVVNPDAAEARADDAMPEYVDRERLEYLVDWAPFLIDYEVGRLRRGMPIDRVVAEVRTEGKKTSVFVVCCRDGTATAAQLEALELSGLSTAPEEE